MMSKSDFDKIELSDRTLVGIMAAIIFTCDGMDVEDAIDLALKLLVKVEELE